MSNVSLLSQSRHFKWAEATSACPQIADISLHRSEPTRKVQSRLLGHHPEMPG